MKVAVWGSGAREDALARHMRRYGEVLVTPGNPAIPGSTGPKMEDTDIDLWVIGPEAPLVEGLADRLRDKGQLVFGPGSDGAQLEGSKIWMKRLLKNGRVRTANFETFMPGEEVAAEAYIRAMMGLIVVKTDYLMAGKGVLVTNDQDEAVADALSKLETGGIVVEEGLIGRELSFFAICYGNGWVGLPTACDYKAVHDGNDGPNTGGMGSFAPVADAPSDIEIKMIIDGTLAALLMEGIDYRGVLYCGLMITRDGIYVLEYNIRFGDPEIQSVLATLDSDLAQVFAKAAAGQRPPEVQSSGASVTVVLAAENYPGDPVKGDVITGIEAAESIEGVTVFYAGVGKDDAGNLVTAGGRVLSITAKADTIAKARAQAYLAVNKIHFRGMHYRTDIAADAV